MTFDFDLDLWPLRAEADTRAQCCARLGKFFVLVLVGVIIIIIIVVRQYSKLTLHFLSLHQSVFSVSSPRLSASGHIRVPWASPSTAWKSNMKLVPILAGGSTRRRRVVRVQASPEGTSPQVRRCASSAPCRAAISPSRRTEYQQRSAAQWSDCNAEIVLGSLRSSLWGATAAVAFVRGNSIAPRQNGSSRTFGYFRNLQNLEEGSVNFWSTICRPHQLITRHICEVEGVKGAQIEGGLKMIFNKKCAF